MTLTTLDPKTALVLIDLQNGIVGQPLVPHSGTETVARGRELAEAFREHGLQVILVNVSFAKDFADVPPGRTDEGGMGGELPPAGWDHIVPELDAQECDLRVTKHNWSAFHGTDLDTQLRRRGVTQIVLAGIRTSIGVESTAREAFAHGYHVTLATDAMADSSLPMHENSVERVFPRLGERGTTAEIIELLAKTRI
jgi:nicotinamidase-related amidase